MTSKKQNDTRQRVIQIEINLEKKGNVFQVNPYELSKL